LDKWTTDHVATWLLGLTSCQVPSSVIKSFKDNGVTGRVILTGLTDDDLREMGIISMFRPKLLVELQKILDSFEEGLSHSVVCSCTNNVTLHIFCVKGGLHLFLLFIIKVIIELVVLTSLL
jgi:hypothetical protein